MTTTAYFHDIKVLCRLHEGPLGAHIDLYAERLLKEGHCHQSGARCIRVVGDFSHWLARKRLDVSDVDEHTVEQHQQYRLRYRHPFASDLPALWRLLEVLREVGAIAPKVPVVPRTLERIEQDFEPYLSKERGLAWVTVIRHCTPLRKFLQEYCTKGVASFPILTGADITRFVERHVHVPHKACARCSGPLLDTCFYRGYITIDLAGAVLSVRTWKFAALPEVLLPEQIQQVLAVCDRRSSIGKRDYAALILLARFGLRANEIAMPTRGDIHWHSSCLMVQGKGRRRASLPLLSEVGSALADYLEHGRPHTDSRRVFVRSLVPHTGFASSAAISIIAVSALTRAGLDVRRKGILVQLERNQAWPLEVSKKLTFR